MTRFFVNPGQMQGETILLTRENAAHAKVLRLKAGEQVLVCDGQGNECLCSIDSIDSGAYSLTVNSIPSLTTHGQEGALSEQ